MKKILFILSIVLFCVSCSDDDKGDGGVNNEDYYKEIKGTWVNYKEDCPTCVNEEFTFSGNNMHYEEYYTGNNTGFSVFFTIDKDNIYTKSNGTYKYKIEGTTLTLTKDTDKHVLTKK